MIEITGNRRRLSRVGLRGTLAVLLAAMAFAAVACGGGSSQSPQEKWAADVCGAVSDWKASLATIATDFSGGVSKSVLTQKVDDVQQATQALVDQLRAIGPPKTQDGEQAKAELDQFAQTASSNVDSIKTEAESLTNAGVAGFTAGVAQISAHVNTIVQSAQTTLDNVEKLDPGGQLETAIQNDATCQSLLSGNG